VLLIAIVDARWQQYRECSRCAHSADAWLRREMLVVQPRVPWHRIFISFFQPAFSRLERSDSFSLTSALPCQRGGRAAEQHKAYRSFSPESMSFEVTEAFSCAALSCLPVSG